MRFRLFLILLLTFSAGRADEEKTTYRWPAGYQGKQRLAVESLGARDDGLSGYQTASFTFLTDVELPKSDWRSIMIVCEGLRGAVSSLPLDIIVSREKKRERSVVRIFSAEEAYHDAGGLRRTVGTYKPRGGDVLIWHRGLTEPDPEQGSFRLAKSPEYDLLVHELSHQITGREFRRLPIWFVEGFAEYLAAAHYAPGKYSFEDTSAAISSHVKKYLGDLAKRDRFKIVPLDIVVRINGRAWAENTRTGEGHGPYLKYVSAVLLFHYFCHLDPKRNEGERVRDFISALREGQPASRATVEQLLDDRSLKDIEREIETFWRAKGLRVDFAL